MSALAPKRETLRTVCAWHDPRPTQINLNISHGICDQCAAEMMGTLQRQAGKLQDLEDVVTALIGAAVEGTESVI